MRKTKELDHHLKHIINNVPIKLEQFESSSEKKMTYYTGNWSTDVANNFTEKQSNKIFAVMDKFKKDVHMFQKKLDSFKDADGVEWSGYEYIGIKK